MTTLADLAGREADLAKALELPRTAARVLIAAKVADAASHASRGLTVALIATPDGRSTTARARKGRAYAAALARLAELADGLSALVADWRDRSYRDGFAWWADRMAEGLRRPGDLRPTEAGASRARGIVLHGEPFRSEVAHAADEAGRRLLAILSRAARKGMPPADAHDLIDGWEKRTAAMLAATADTLLSDSQIAADHLGMRDVVRPELLDGGS